MPINTELISTFGKLSNKPGSTISNLFIQALD